jgi:polar amino acid transport system substrate-binding protein
VPTIINFLFARLLPGLLFSTGALAAACPPLTRVGVSDLGYSAFRQDGKLQGAAIDMIRELGTRTGCQLNFEWFPRERMFVQLESGRIDLIASGARTPERDRLALFAPYVTGRFDLVLSRRVHGNFHSLADFIDHSDARLNVVRGMHFVPEVAAQIERLRAQGRVEWVNDYEVVFWKISMERAEATLAPAVIHQWHVRQAGLQDKVSVLQISEAPVRLAGAYLSSRTLAPETRELYARTIHDMVADGTAQKIYRRYLDDATVRTLFRDGGRAILAASSSP